jgi:hypothetical protein
MKTKKILGIVFLAILAINAVVLTATSSAAITKLTSLLPEGTAKVPITFTDKGGAGTLIALGEKEGVECKENTSSGSITSLTLGTGEIKFKGCKLPAGLGGAACEDLTTKVKEQITVKGALHFLTGLLAKKEVPAFVVLPEPLHFECSTLLFLILAKSCSAGEILTPNVLTKTVKVQFIQAKETKGDPDVNPVGEANEKHTEFGCFVKFNLNESKTILEGAIEQIKNEEELTGFKQGPNAVEALVMFA